MTAPHGFPLSKTTWALVASVEKPSQLPLAQRFCLRHQSKKILAIRTIVIEPVFVNDAEARHPSRFFGGRSVPSFPITWQGFPMEARPASVQFGIGDGIL